MTNKIWLRWSGSTVLDGTATDVCAIETARAFDAGNFTGRRARDTVKREFDEGRALKMLRDFGNVSGSYSDETGRADWRIEAKG